MIYDKLPVVFLSTIASEKKDATNSLIASYILEHLQTMQDIGIKDMAAQCNVSLSSISRFCKEIGLRDFNELKELIRTTDLNFEEVSREQSTLVETYGHHVQQSIDLATKTMDVSAMQRLVKDLVSYERVAAFGLLKASCAAICFETDMLMLGKQVYCNVSYAEQIRYLEKAGRNDLILIFSYTGAYFDFADIRRLGRKLMIPKIWLIASSDKPLPSFINDAVYFQSDRDQLSHPYQLQVCAGAIAQLYAAEIRKDNAPD